MASHLLAVAAFASAAAAAPALGPVEVDMYRAMNSDDLQRPLGNDAMASILGVLAYIHTEALPEHGQEHHARAGRRNMIDVIAQTRVRVRNPDAVTDQSMMGPTHGRLSSKVDFGKFMAFLDGRAASQQDVIDLAEHGDMVGAQRWTNPAFAVSDDQPYYWFSLSGPCPNRTWREKRAAAQREECTNSGGLCEGNAGPPTGEPGCVYTYGGNGGIVTLDEWAGITKETCIEGGQERPCRDWADFRLHCAKDEYRQKFPRWASMGTYPVSSRYCVEYDIVPACDVDCMDPECQDVPPAERELGLPFWRGRCDPVANARRAELLAVAFGIGGAADDHGLVDPGLLEAPRTCVTGLETFRLCNPVLEYGGQYCSRRWGGVCEPCYVPNTTNHREIGQAPLCPYDILSLPDYTPASKFAPKCKSRSPRDLCCLYADACNTREKDPANVTLDDDGYAIVASLQSTEKMLAFLQRIADETLEASLNRASDVAEFAYRQWSHQPLKGRNFAGVRHDLSSPYLSSPYLIYRQQPSTHAPSSPAGAAVSPAAGTQRPVERRGGFPAWGWVLIVLGIAALGGLAGLAAFFFGSASRAPVARSTAARVPEPSRRRPAPAAKATSRSRAARPCPSSLADGSPAEV